MTLVQRIQEARRQYNEARQDQARSESVGELMAARQRTQILRKRLNLLLTQEVEAKRLAG